MSQRFFPEHPVYTSGIENYTKWRTCYDGGDNFVRCYLEKFSRRETADEFCKRRKLTPIPGFAKTAINEVKNSIHQRMVDVTRSGGSYKYQRAAAGENGGVDNRGRAMNSFFAEKVLADLLVVGKYGVYVDAPEYSPSTLATQDTHKPYLCGFRAEDIVNWRRSDPENPSEFQALTLRENYMSYDDNFGMPNGWSTRMRHIWIDPNDGYVRVKYFACGEDGNHNSERAIKLQLRKIPFVLFDLGDSIMKDVADHQIALLNLWSSNVAYGLNANYPFYTEQRDGRGMGAHLKPAANSDGTATTGGQPASDSAITVGTTKGRSYQAGMDRPGFIHPSSEPLVASIDMCKQLKDDIRQLVSLAISDLGARNSAQSKEMDNQGLEAGLSYIGVVLETGERQVAEYWSKYENSIQGKQEVATIAYPRRWNLKTDVQRVQEATGIYEACSKIPGQKVKKAASKHLVTALLANKLTADELASIHKEIEEADYSTSDPKIIEIAREQGLVGDETGSMALGFNKGEATKAQKDHIKKLAEIQKSQTSPNKPNTDNTPIQGVTQTTAEAVQQKAAEKSNSDGFQQKRAQRGNQKSITKDS